jgi:hypothetical protein
VLAGVMPQDVIFAPLFQADCMRKILRLRLYLLWAVSAAGSVSTQSADHVALRLLRLLSMFLARLRF